MSGGSTNGLSTSFTRLVGIERPIVQAPIGELATPELAAAVSEAGGLGMLACTWTEPDTMREHIAATQRLTDRPFGVNLILDWDQAKRVEAALDAGVRIVSFFWGDPGALVARCHDRGAIVLLTVGNAEEARRAVEAGVDVVVAQGWEAGGHVWGEVSTIALVPAVVDAVAPIPVVAAGGIADGRGLAAVLALGASAAWMGTRFVLAAETPAHPVYRQMLLAARETDTFHSSVFDVEWPEAPHRTLRNSTVDAWEAAGRPAAGGRPGEGEIIGTLDDEPIRRYESASIQDGVEGDVEAMSLWAGQSVGLVDSIEPAGDIVRRVTTEAVAILGDRPR
jgi:NAD(P)H-dependent flavin oxidoreductase YrpB (nitropropane dioxygenase family)